jgi:glycogen(starch) synthase
LRPDVLHVQCFGPNGVYATLLSFITRVPLVISLQGETVMDDHDAFEHSTTLRTALRLGLRRAAAVTACSQFTLDDAETRFGLKAGRGQVIFNGVSLEEQGSQVAPPSNGAGRYIIAFGRVVPKKGFDLLIRAFARVSAAHRDVTLTIGGDGSSRADLEALAKELEIADQVRFPGRLDRGEVAAALAGAEIFVMPSRLEPFGIVLLEAWRAGRPVVATSIGGPPEFLEDGRTGLLVDPNDTDALAAALERLLGDRALREAIGAAGRLEVQEFSWVKIAQTYQDLYRQLQRPVSSVSTER